MARIQIIFSPAQGAAYLWRYGEDSLSDRALGIPDDDMVGLWRTAGAYYLAGAENMPLSSRLFKDKACAFALIHYFEGGLRPLARERRRAEKTMPAHLANPKPIPQTDEWFARIHQKW